MADAAKPPAETYEATELPAAGTEPAARTVPEPANRFRRGKPSDGEVGGQIDDFDILARLGEGGFAIVYLARQRSMQRLVALKVSSDQGAEPQTLAQLDHPHIVRVYDQRTIPARGLRLLYMPYLAGGTLKDVVPFVQQTPPEQRTGQLLLNAVDAALERRGELPPTDSSTRAMLAEMTWPDAVCWLGARLAEALAYAHQHNVLHRDIKPANVLLGADAGPRLADFNISFAAQLEGDAGDSFGGSLAYMSPEHIEVFGGRREVSDLDERADIYSLGVTLWELLTGSRPFAQAEPDGELQTLTSMLERRTSGIIPAMELTLPQGMPEGLRDVLMKCLRTTREDRYQRADEVAKELELCLKPRARELLLPKSGWRTWSAKHPYWTLLAIGLVINGIAALVSIEYNRTALVDHYPAAESMFQILQIIINGTFFPLCTYLFYRAIRPVARGLANPPKGAAELLELRRGVLRLGHISVLVCLWAWVAAGVLFPVTLHFSVQNLPLDFHLHFLASQTLCGLITVSYPQFAVTIVALRAFYPRFVGTTSLNKQDVLALRAVDKSQNGYLVVAASVPMLAVGLLASIGAENRIVLVGLSIAGVLGAVVAYFFTRAIHADCVALESVARTN